MSSSLQLAVDGLWRQNPALVQLLGLCPLLAVSNTMVNSLVLGIVTLVVMTGANLMVSAVRGLLNDTTRLPAQIMIIATFVTLADLFLQAFYFEIHQRIGLFVALIVTNCVILGRTESFGRRNGLLLAGIDGFMMGAGFCLAIVALGTLREALGQGTLLAGADLLFGAGAASWTINLPVDGVLLVLLPPGAFISFGCLIALKNWIDQQTTAQQSTVQKEAPADE